MSVLNLKRIALFVEKLLGDVRRKSNEIANFHTPRVFNATDEGVTLGIWYRRKVSRMLLCWGYQIVEKVFRYV